METENTVSQTSQVREYLETWAAAFTEVLQQLAAPDCRATIVQDAAEIARVRETTPNGLRVSLVCEGALAGRQVLRISAEGALALARLQRGDAENDPAPEGAQELLWQVAGQAATRLTGNAGEPVRCRVEKQDEGDWESAAEAVIRLEGVTSGPIDVLMETDEACGQSLLEKGTADESTPPDQPGSQRQEEGRNLDLLLDVELEASIRFGQKELLLKDVLDLRPGTVVELARQVNEPAELLVAGRLMARGEVVVVEGNYGLRITEILGPAERMAAIRG